ncbi:MAG: TraB/GumN family protein [Bacteroidales bacterium]|nr:TraB/GumN family protein [Bacteroidales bacterium]MBN2764509.1 TraB/GumN family protein [Bacteroidales bacterium]
MSKSQCPILSGSLLTLTILILLSSSADAQSLLWKIEADDHTSPSYIYGTIHIKDKRVFQFDEEVNEALKACSLFAMEVDLNPEKMTGFAQQLMLPEGQTLQNIFEPDDYELIKTIIESETGMDMSWFDHMKPFALLSMAMNSQIHGEMEMTIDEFFYHQATKEGKKIIGLETIEEQLDMLEKIPPRYIVDYFRNFHQGMEDIEEIIRLYCLADLDKLLVLMQEDKAMATMEKQMITTRNQRMTERIIPLLKDRPTFIAIGAGHLPGKKGVLKLLEKKGYALTPVMTDAFECAQ